MTAQKPEPAGAVPRLPRELLRCFDADLRVRRELFERAVRLWACNERQDERPFFVVDSALNCGGGQYELSPLLDRIDSLATQAASQFYIHHHDNVAAEVAVYEPYARAGFLRRLRLFRTAPAAEGGANLLGIIDHEQAWLLVLQNDNQGMVALEWFGPAQLFRNLADLDAGSANAASP